MKNKKKLTIPEYLEYFTKDMCWKNCQSCGSAHATMIFERDEVKTYIYDAYNSCNKCKHKSHRRVIDLRKRSV